jgi:hypothetical protein
MFLVNSRLDRLPAATECFRGELLHTPVALLIPKLRSYFAEFLNEGYLDHLRVLTPAHQCRFAVRAPTVLATKLFLPVQTQQARLDLRLRLSRGLRLTWRRI